ncbi:hypothetical protein WAX74_12900 [Psychrobacillus sp. FJAT-51614]|uniref:Uncharacterized protein n=1 Tax=Psychrobacillus mangrovi TaxID=3117745 RepID=A0ABU8F6B1_9BACI
MLVEIQNQILPGLEEQTLFLAKDATANRITHNTAILNHLDGKNINITSVINGKVEDMNIQFQQRSSPIKFLPGMEVRLYVTMLDYLLLAFTKSGLKQKYKYLERKFSPKLTKIHLFKILGIS